MDASPSSALSSLVDWGGSSTLYTCLLRTSNGPIWGECGCFRCLWGYRSSSLHVGLSVVYKCIVCKGTFELTILLSLPWLLLSLHNINCGDVSSALYLRQGVRWAVGDSFRADACAADAFAVVGRRLYIALACSLDDATSLDLHFAGRYREGLVTVVDSNLL